MTRARHRHRRLVPLALAVALAVPVTLAAGGRATAQDAPPPDGGSPPPTPTPAPPTDAALGGSIPFEEAALTAELARVGRELEKATDDKVKERLTSSKGSLERALAVLRERAALAARVETHPGRTQAADEESKRVGIVVAKPVEVPEPFRRELLDEARAREKERGARVDALTAELARLESAPERLRTEETRTQTTIGELEAARRGLVERRAPATTPAEKALLDRRTAITDVEIATARERLTLIKASRDAARTEVPILRAELANATRLLERVRAEVAAFLAAEERRLEAERLAAEEEARRLEVLERMGKPFERTRAAVEAELGRGRVDAGELAALENRWSQHEHHATTTVAELERTATALIERVDTGDAAGAERRSVVITRLRSAHRRSTAFFAATLGPEATDATATLATLRARRSELEDRRLRLADDIGAARASAKASFDQLHTRFPTAYPETVWTQEAVRWAALLDESTALVSERQATIDRIVDLLLAVEELAVRERQRNDRIGSILRTAAFWTRESPAVDGAGLTAAAADVAAALGRVRAEARAGAPSRLGALLLDPRTLLALIVGAILGWLLGRVVRPRLLGRVRAALAIETAEPPHPFRRRLARDGWRLLEKSITPVAILVVAIAVAAAAGGALAWGGARVVAVIALTRLAVVLARVLLRPLEPEWRLTRIPDGAARLIHRVLARLIIAVGTFGIAWALVPAFSEAARPALRALLPLAFRGIASVAIALAASDPVVTGAILRAVSRPLSERLGRFLVAFQVFVGAATVGILVLDGLGYRNAAGAVTASLVLSLALIVIAVLLDRLLVALALSRLDPIPIEADTAGEAAPKAADGDVTTETAEALETAAERRQFVRKLAGGTVTLSVFTAAAAAIVLIAFEVERTTLERLLETSIVTSEDGTSLVAVGDLAAAALIFAGTILVHGVFRGLVAHFILNRVGLSRGARFAITTVAGYLIIAVGVVWTLRLLQIDLGQLDWFLAAAGVGIGFGLQEIMSNFVSGLILFIERPVEVGDVVTVSEVEGEVTRITIRATTVRTGDNISIIVPNKEFVTGTVTNWSHGDPQVRLRIPVGVSYGSDISLVRQTLLEVARNYGRILKHPSPEVGFIGFGGSSLDFHLLVWLAQPDPTLRRTVTSDLCFAITAAFRRAGIEIPFHQVDLHVRDGETLRIETAVAESTEPAEPAPPPALP